MNYTIAEITRVMDGEVFDVEPHISVHGVSTDSRTVREGDIFFAIKGERFDGHDFTGMALAKGAVACVVERGCSYHALPRIEVADTVVALGSLAKYHKNKALPSTSTIGITGSVGKTTTKELIALVLSKEFRVSKSPKSFNNAIGVPLTIFNTKSDVDFIVAEVGTNHNGEIAYLASRLLPDIAVLTRVGYAHIGFFGSTEAIAHEKADLFRILHEGGLAVLNADSPHVEVFRKSIPSGVQIVTYGFCEDADIRAKNLESIGINRTKFDVFGFPFEVNLPMALAENALAAIALGQVLGISLERIQKAISEFSGLPMRMEFLEVEGVKIVNDAYNANPDSMNALFRTFARYPDKDRLVFVLGDMLELGDLSEELHREVGRMFVKSGFKKLIAVGKDARFLAEEVTFGGAKVFYFESTDGVAQLLAKILRRGDIVVLKASRAMELEKIVEELKNALPSALSA